MIEFERFELKNGLQVIVHHDSSTPIVAFNLTYKVGARDENPDRTGFAHLFEHLMFGGSKNIPSFDKPLQAVGGENNAFTSNDITNYYITLPKSSLETAFWLESDRMNELAFSEKSLDVQRQVVVEEFKQRYINQPYGDVYLLLRPLAYLKHPYRWPTIGKEIKHIEEATMEEVKSFFYSHYRPNNAVLSIAGDVSFNEIKELSEKWFGDIPEGNLQKINYPKEDKQTSPRILKVERDLPLHAVYMAYHMVDRLHPDYYAFDLLSDILSRGNSSRMYQRLVKGKRIMNEANAYIGGDIDEGLFTLAAFVNPGFTIEQAVNAMEDEIEEIKVNGVSEEELLKTKNKIEATLSFAQTSVLNKAMGLGIAEVIQSADLVNLELELYKKVNVSDVQRIAKKYLTAENCSTLMYQSKSQLK